VAQLSETTSFSGGADSIVERRIEFTLLDNWSILWFRENEENAPRFQRSGKKAGGVCVFGGGDFAVGPGLGFGFAGCGDGLLRWVDVPAAWSCAEEEFGRFQPGEGCGNGRLRASRTKSGDGLQHGLLPSERTGCDRGCCFCGAGCCDLFCAAYWWACGAWLRFFGSFVRY
jgi:hypothetical protein